MTTHNDIILSTQFWINTFVIKHNLCPFAKQPYEAKLLDYHVVEHSDPELILGDFHKYVTSIAAVDPSQVSNAFFILNDVNLGFLEYLDLFDLAQVVLEDIALDDLFQLVSFHPQYQFSGTSLDHPSNFANRSPYPMIHVLRVDEVEKAIETGEDIGTILQRNSDTLDKLFG